MTRPKDVLPLAVLAASLITPCVACSEPAGGPALGGTTDLARGASDARGGADGDEADAGPDAGLPTGDAPVADGRVDDVPVSVDDADDRDVQLGDGDGDGVGDVDSSLGRDAEVTEPQDASDSDAPGPGGRDRADGSSDTSPGAPDVDSDTPDGVGPADGPLVFAIAGQSNAEGNATLSGLRKLVHAMPDHDAPLTEVERWELRRAVFGSQGVWCDVNLACFEEPASCGGHPYQLDSADALIDALRAGSVDPAVFHLGYQHPTVTIRPSLYGNSPVQLLGLDGEPVSNGECELTPEATTKTGPQLTAYSEPGVYPLAPGFAPNPADPADRLYGPELSFGAVVGDAHPDATLVKVAMGGSSLGDHWRPGGTLFEQLVAQTDAALADTGGQLGGLVWFQGFNDQFEDVYCEPLAPAYLEHLVEFLDAFWEHYDAPVPVVIVKARSGFELDVIQDAQQTLADIFTHVAAVESADLSECFHYDSGSQIVIGERAGHAMLALLGGDAGAAGSDDDDAPPPACAPAACDGSTACDADGCDCLCPAPLGCCEAQGGPGCAADAAAEACVCALDPFCCSDFWDGVCVDLLATGCGLDCAHEPSCGDGACDGAVGESCATCEADCGACGGDSDCCDVRADGGCSEPPVEACVCEADPACCVGPWGADCVALAAHGCEAACETCGDGVCAPDEGCASCEADCGACPVASDCCDGSEGPGCADPVCEATVCAEDGFCCANDWDGQCVNLANQLCAGCVAASDGCGDGACAGAESCETCPGDCGACEVGPCCQVSVASGCPDAPCEAKVCELDPACCAGPWDAFCVGVAAATCGCGGDGGCGDGLCDEGDETCQGCPFDCGPCPAMSDCCVPHDGPGCDDPVCQAQTCDADFYCCDVLWDGLCAAEAADDCTVCEGNPDAWCGDGTCQPFEACSFCPADCGECPCEPAGPTDCCASKPDPGCNDDACEEAACLADPFCCGTQWDDICANWATANCEVCADGGVPGVCGDGTCDADQCEDCDSCPGDCGPCDGESACGDGTCDPDSESCGSCPGDCGPCGGESACGDGTCDPDSESCESCPGDCGPCPEGDCCQELEGPTCPFDAACSDVVCELDPYCCEGGWDGACGQCAAGGPGYDGVDCSAALEPCGCGE